MKESRTAIRERRIALIKEIHDSDPTKRYTLVEWAERTGIPYTTVKQYLAKLEIHAINSRIARDFKRLALIDTIADLSEMYPHVEGITTIRYWADRLNMHYNTVIPLCRKANLGGRYGKRQQSDHCGQPRSGPRD